MTLHFILVILIFEFQCKGEYNMVQETIQAKWTMNTESKVYQDAIQIRYEVFIKEQAFPEGSDIDHLEEDSEHLVLYDGDYNPLAAARIIEISKDVYRIERVVVLKEARKQGLGRILMNEMERRIKENGGQKITLKSESTAVGFYKKFGYQKVGEEFLDYHIMHQTMEKQL